MIKRCLGLSRSGLGLGSVAMVLVMPKCPLCIAAWAWPFTALRLDFDQWNRTKWFVAMAFLGVAVVLLGMRANLWARMLLISSAALGLTLKMAYESQLNALMILGWMLSFLPQWRSRRYLQDLVAGNDALEPPRTASALPVNGQNR